MWYNSFLDHTPMHSHVFKEGKTMRTKFRLFSIVSTLFLSFLICTGCSMLFANKLRMRDILGKWETDKKICLYQVINRDNFGDSNENYCELVLTVSSGDSVLLSQSIARREGSWKAPPKAFAFGNIEGRTNANKQRFWIVDIDKGHVVTSIDWDTREITGPDDKPPSWAELKGGTVLKAVVP